MNKTQILWFAVPVVAILTWRAITNGAGHARVDGKTAQALVQQGARLVDVRTPEEFNAEHLPNAINVPVQELPQRTKELEPKDAPIVLYCRSGHRSGVAYEALKSSGFTRLYDLGPMSAW